MTYETPQAPPAGVTSRRITSLGPVQLLRNGSVVIRRPGAHRGRGEEEAWGHCEAMSGLHWCSLSTAAQPRSSGTDLPRGAVPCPAHPARTAPPRPTDTMHRTNCELCIPVPSWEIIASGFVKRRRAARGFIVVPWLVRCGRNFTFNYGGQGTGKHIASLQID